MSGTEWYVAIGTANGIRMTIAADRDAAIRTASAMLQDGVDIREIGPMIEPPEGKIISGAEFRRRYGGAEARAG